MHAYGEWNNKAIHECVMVNKKKSTIINNKYNIYMRDFAAVAQIEILKVYPVFVFVQHHQGLTFADM